jgi:hypothetical protein
MAELQKIRRVGFSRLQNLLWAVQAGRELSFAYARIARYIGLY